MGAGESRVADSKGQSLSPAWGDDTTGTKDKEDLFIPSLSFRPLHREHGSHRKM